ncbi:MAG: hypothetical protein H3C31_10810 [Brumimicrobium sp.]|nr:hypothetical protein [Brumimicrobium sp.]
MKRFNIITLVLTFGSILFSVMLQAQFELIGNYRVRSEFADGYKQPLMKGQEPGFYIHQGAILGAKYKHERFHFTFSVNDIRTWGSTSYDGIEKGGFFSIREANVAVIFNKNWQLKVGRQQLKYDNERIFSPSGWGMQGIRHDAAILKFNYNDWKLDIGGAYNQNANSNIQTFYTLNQYKTFQYAWVNKKWNSLSASIIFLNNGVEQTYFNQDSIEKKRTNFTQTMGSHLEFTKEKYGITLFGYYQMGMTPTRQVLSAFDLSLEANYKPIKGLSFALGGEVLSGTSQLMTANNRNYSYQTLHSTRHSFNGYMDYFYSGNHQNSVGLIDAYFKLGYKFKQFHFKIDNHAFFSHREIMDLNAMDPLATHHPYLGYEMDFTFIYQMIDEVAIQAGYSFMLGTKALRDLKGVNQTKLQNWAYIMITVQPFKNLKIKGIEKKEKEDL